MAKSNSDSSSDQKGYQFGTFKGVFTPSILTILGVVMYLRFGWVLGSLGLGWTLVMVTVCCSITFLTGLSLSALATNMRVGGGGAYFIISRTLGVESGAALGLPLYAAQALGIAFYVTGFAESIVAIFPYADIRMVGVVTLIVVAVIAYVSADTALKTQFIVMTIIILSLGSLVLGTGEGIAPVAAKDYVNLDTNGFFVVFAVFFPAVTGIEAGIAMSGDLKDPAKSLPRGTLGAVLSGYVVYMLIPLFLSFTLGTDNAARQLLVNNKMLMQHIARWGWVIVAGVWAASLSSAMGAILGAPRTLQALAQDGIVPRFLGKGFGPGNDPRFATILSFLVALVGVVFGDLNKIANLLTMFFLTSYGLLNICAALESFASPPSWRPKFRVHWSFSLIGACGCFGAMFMIDAGSTFIAGFVIAVVYYFVKQRKLKAHWGDIRSGIMMMLARFAIHSLAKRPPEERTWKPNILVLSGSITKRWYLIELASSMSQERGFLTVAAIVPATFRQERIAPLSQTISDYLEKREISALVKVYPAEEPMVGLRMLTKTYGFGPLVPNTILLGETEKPHRYMDFAELTMQIHRQGQNLIVVRESEEEETDRLHKGELIDLWWSGMTGNEGLMLALAHMLKRNPGWRNAKFYLKTIVRDPAKTVSAQRRLDEFIKRARLDAHSLVLTEPEGAVFDIIREESQGADIVFLGMRPPDDEESKEDYNEYYKTLVESTTGMPPLALVMAAKNIDFTALFKES